MKVLFLRALLKKLDIIGKVLLFGLGLILAFPVVAMASMDMETSRLINAGEFEEAKNLLLSADPSQADKAFFDGRIFKAKGDYKKAVRLFRMVLRLDPTHVNARRELAHTLMLDGNLDGAEAHFEYLLEANPNSQMRDGYLNFLNAIDAAQPFGASFNGALLPSTNVNRGSTEEVYTSEIGEGRISSQKESGLGVRLGVNAYARKSIDQNRQFVARGALNVSKYTDQDFDSALGMFSLSLEQKYGRTQLAMTPYLRRSFRREGDDNTVFGGAFSAQHRFENGSSASGSLRYEERDYRLTDNQDGPFLRADVEHRRSLGDGFSLRLGFGAEKRAPQIEYQQYKGFDGFVGITKAWKGGLNTSIKAGLGSRLYEKVFPLSLPSVRRKDTFYRFHASAFDSRFTILDFAPKLSCSYELNNSNIALYQYDSVDCQVSLTQRF